MDVIRIRGLELDCIVGLRPEERVHTQRLRVDLALGIDTREAGRTGRIASTLDYDRIAEDILALLRFRRYQLIEVATEELSAMLLGAYPSARWVELRLEKPGALSGRAEAASIEVRRSREDYPSPEPATDGTAQELVLRTRDAELWVIDVESGETLPEVARGVRVLQRVVSGQLFSSDGRVWPAGLTEPECGLANVWSANGTSARVFRCVVLPNPR